MAAVRGQQIKAVARTFKGQHKGQYSKSYALGSGRSIFHTQEKAAAFLKLS